MEGSDQAKATTDTTAEGQVPSSSDTKNVPATETPRKMKLDKDPNPMGDNSSVNSATEEMDGSAQTKTDVGDGDGDIQISDTEGMSNANTQPGGDGCLLGKKASRCPFAPLAKYMKMEDFLLLLGIGLSTIIFFHRKMGFMMRHWIYQEGEGHIVSKFLVVMMIPYTISFMKMATEFLALMDNYLNICSPLTYRKFRINVENFRLKYPVFLWLRNRKTCKVITMPLATMIGVMIWDIIWIAFVCKSHHDRSCTKTMIGKMLYDYRKEACSEGKETSAVCEKIVAYLPVIVLTICVSVMGNLIIPLLIESTDTRILNRAHIRRSVGKRSGSKIKIMSPIHESAAQEDRTYSDSDLFDYNDESETTPPPLRLKQTGPINLDSEFGRQQVLQTTPIDPPCGFVDEDEDGDQ